MLSSGEIRKLQGLKTSTEYRTMVDAAKLGGFG